jgi:hypothetical protein
VAGEGEGFVLYNGQVKVRDVYYIMWQVRVRDLYYIMDR